MSKKFNKNSRLLLMKEYGKLYSRWYPDEGKDCCVYCGDDATCLDHCPPLESAQLVVKDHRARKKYDIYFILLQSCSSCNSRLGSKPFLTLYERTDFIMRSIEKEYEKKFTLWSKEEEKEMSPMFRKIIQSKRAELANLSRRVRWSQWRLMNLDGV